MLKEGTLLFSFASQSKHLEEKHMSKCGHFPGSAGKQSTNTLCGVNLALFLIQKKDEILPWLWEQISKTKRKSCARKQQAS